MNRVVVVTLLGGVFLGAVINNVAAAPLALIADDLGVTPQSGTVIVSASGFALACLMPLGGWVSGLIGSRTSVVGCFVLLAVGCLAAGLAQNVPVLAAARVLQGVSMAVVPPVVMIGLPAYVRGGSRERALSMWAVANGAGTACGAPVGALLADGFGWRWSFLAFVPLCLLAAAGATLLRDEKRDSPSGMADGLLLTVGIAMTLSPALTLDFRLSPPAVVLLLGAGVAVTSAMLVRQGRTSRFLSGRFVTSLAFARAAAGGFAQLFVLGAVAVLLPLSLVRNGLASVGAAGTLLLCVTVIMMVSAPVAGWLSVRWGPHRVIPVGLFGCAGWIWAVVLVVRGSGNLWVLASLLLMLGFFVACIQAPSAIQASMAPAAGSAEMGMFNSVRFGGQVMGTALLSITSIFALSPTDTLVVTGAVTAGLGSLVLALAVADRRAVAAA